MVVCKCNSCGNFIHIGKDITPKCMYCDSPVNVEYNADETYVEMRINECEEALGGLKALELYDECIERFPNISRLYWGRLLARHSCKVDKQLLSHGVNFSEDHDYVLACHFASDEERLCYEKLASCRNTMMSVIMTELVSNEKELIRQTGIKKNQMDAASEIERLRETLELKLSELDFVEKQVRDLQTDCMVGVISNRKAIDYTVDGIDKFKSQINAQKEIENDDYKKLLIEIGKLFYVCSRANNEIKNLQQKDEYHALQQLKQDQTVAQRNVDDIISQIEEVNENMRTIISKVAVIKDKHKKASDAAKNNGFAEASSLLGSEKMNMILINALKA